MGRRVLDELERRDQKVLVGVKIAENSILCRYIRSSGLLLVIHPLFLVTMGLNVFFLGLHTKCVMFILRYKPWYRDLGLEFKGLAPSSHL